MGGCCIRAKVARFEIGICYLQSDRETIDNNSQRRAEYWPDSWSRPVIGLPHGSTMISQYLNLIKKTYSHTEFYV